MLLGPGVLQAEDFSWEPVYETLAAVDSARGFGLRKGPGGWPLYSFFSEVDVIAPLGDLDLASSPGARVMRPDFMHVR